MDVLDEPLSPWVRWANAIGYATIWCALTVGLGAFTIARSLGASEPTANNIGLVLWILSSVPMALVFYAVDLPRPRDVSHGSAAFMSAKGVRLLTKGPGHVVGRDPVSRRLIRYDGPAHLMTIAPTRSGKGVGSVIPNLLEYPGAVVCVDPKGENARATAEARRRFGPVWVLDPFGASGAVPSTYNPLDAIGIDAPEAGEAAALLADAIAHDPPGQAGDVHWNEEARALIAGLLLQIVQGPGERRDLGELRRLLTLPPARFQRLLGDMAQSAAAGGLVARAANRQLGKADREAAGVLSTAQRHTHFLDSRRIVEATARSDFALDGLRETAGTLYCVLPPERLATHGRWLRLMVSQALAALAGAAPARRRPVLFLLDEFTALGRLEPAAQAMSLMAGYGVQLWPILQDIHQLHATYGLQAGTFLSNVGCLQVFNVNDLDTAEWVSRLLGDTTADEAAGAYADTLAGRVYAGPNDGAALPYAEPLRRPLLTPDEVRRLPGDQSLIFISGYAPILATKVRYFADREFRAYRDTIGPARPGLALDLSRSAVVDHDRQRIGAKSGGSADR